MHIIYGIPICTLIFRNYYATAVPNEIIEAARVDGAGMLRTYWSIVLPISAPGFVVTLIWQFTSAWNDFLFALFLTHRATARSPTPCSELAGGQNPDYAVDHGRRAGRVAAHSAGLHRPGQVLHRRPDERIGQVDQLNPPATQSS